MDLCQGKGEWMPRKTKIYDWGFCEGCGAPMRLKPAHRKYCKPRCRYQNYNRTRGRGTMETAQQFLTEHCTTVAEAVAMGAGTKHEIRSRIRRNELPVIRIYG